MNELKFFVKYLNNAFFISSKLKNQGKADFVV